MIRVEVVMRVARSFFGLIILILVLTTTLVLALHNTGIVSAQGTPPASTISTTSGGVAWDFAPVVAGTFTNVGIQDICPPGMCDDHDLTIEIGRASCRERV